MYDLKAEGVTISNTKAVFSSLKVSDSSSTEEHSDIITSHEVYSFEIEALKKTLLRRSTGSISGFHHQDSVVDIFKTDDEEEKDVVIPQLGPSLRSPNFRAVMNRPNRLLKSGAAFYKRYFKRTKTRKSPKDLNFMRDYILRQESALRNDSTSLFYWVSLGDLTALQEKMLVTTDLDSRLYDVDPTGANIVHKAYLSKFYHMGRWMVESYPFLALKPYSNQLPEALERMGFSSEFMPFTGLTILHIVIVRREYEEVRWLLDFYKDHRDSVPNGLAQLLQCNITGYSFRFDGDYYFGGLPLHFAVCSNSIEVFDLVLSYAASLENDVLSGEFDHHGLKEVANLGQNVIFMRDSVGNTVLHLCAIHGLEAMFEHVYKTAESIIVRELKILYSKHSSTDKHQTGLYDLPQVWKGEAGYSLHPKKIRLPVPEKYHEWLHAETKVKMDERLMLALNKDLHSPLTLAASISRKKGIDRDNIFKSLISSQKKTLWNYGPIRCSELSLDGIETKYNLEKFGPKIKTSNVDREHSAITWLCLSGSEDSIVLPEVKHLIEAKWKIFGLPLFMLESVFDVTITVLVTLQLMFINFGPTLYPYTAFDYFIDILYASTFIVFSWSAFEKIEILRRNYKDYWRMHGVGRFHVLCQNIKVCAFALFFGFQMSDAYSSTRFGTCYLQNESENQQDLIVMVAMSVCALVSWVHIYYYLMGFETTGPFLLVLSRIVVKDIPYFVQFFVFVLLGLACSISMVADDGSNPASDGLWTLCEITFGLIQRTVNVLPAEGYPSGMIDANSVDTQLIWVQDIMITFFYATVVFVLLNMLIAIMTKTYLAYSSYNEAFFLIEKYHIMEYFEKHMTEEELIQHKQSYCTKKLHHHEHEHGEHGANSQNAMHFLPTYSFELREVMQNWLHLPPSLTLEDMKTFKKTSLFIVDPQVDLHSGGPLSVPGALEASQRIANIIRKNKHFIHEIFVSLKSSSVFHITHASFWRGKNGHRPKVYTTISYNDVKTGVWNPHDRSEAMREWCLAYTKELERKGRPKLTIWPEHCIIGSRGHAVVPCINEALQEWAAYSKRAVTYITKGRNYRTEAHSALEAEVVDPLDFSTSLNTELLALLRVADRVMIL